MILQPAIKVSFIRQEMCEFINVFMLYYLQEVKETKEELTAVKERLDAVEKENKRLHEELEFKINQIEVLELSTTDVHKGALKLLEENHQLRTLCQKQRDSNEMYKLELEVQNLKLKQEIEKATSLLEKNTKLKEENEQLKREKQDELNQLKEMMQKVLDENKKPEKENEQKENRCSIL